MTLPAANYILRVSLEVPSRRVIRVPGGSRVFRNSLVYYKLYQVYNYLGYG